MQLTRAIYEISANFPKHELYDLTSRVRRCAVPIPSNIAEGHNRESTKDYLRFLAIAQGSLAELEPQISLACMMNYIEQEKEQILLLQADEIGKMLRGLQIKLSEKLLELAPRS